MIFLLILILLAVCFPKSIGAILKLALGVGFLLLAAAII